MSKGKGVNSKYQDFDPDKYVTSSDHAQHVEDLGRRLSYLEEKFGDNEKIATTLKNAAENAVKMQTLFADTFVTLLKTNDTIKSGISDIVNKLDRKYTVLFMKRFGFISYTLAISIISAIAGAIVKAYISH